MDHGFRLPSALDNRPLRFEEFVERTGQVILLSATPGPWELEHSANVVEQVIRPTGLVDPEVDIRPTTGQIDDLRERIDRTVAAGYRVLVTTLTKKMAEDLTDYLAEQRVRVQYLHSDVDTMARIEILRDLRLGDVRRPGGHQPAARGSGPARGGPRGHPGRRQGGVPAIHLLPHPDHGPGRPQRERPGGDVRRHHHRFHDQRHRGDPATAGPSDGVQPGPRHRSPHHHQVGHRHPRAGPGGRRWIGRPHLGGQRAPGREAGAEGPFRRGRPPGGGGGDGPRPRTRRRPSCPA